MQPAPAGGWPSVNEETLAALRGNDTVIDLLRNLPYPDYGAGLLAFAPCLMNETPAVDYRREDIQKMIREGKIEGVAAPTTDQDPAIPPSCAAITICRSYKGYWVVLDTDDGYIYWVDPNGQHDEPEPELNSTLERVDEDEKNEWRYFGCNVYEPADFFELCKERHRELRWIGIMPWTMSVMRANMDWEYMSEPDPDISDPEDDASHGKIARKMKKAGGWPGDGEGRDWDRTKFMRLCQRNDEEV